MNNDPHPVMDAVERLLANHHPLENYPGLLLAFLNWYRSQEIDPNAIPGSVATLLGLIIGMRGMTPRILRWA